MSRGLASSCGGGLESSERAAAEGCINTAALSFSTHTYTQSLHTVLGFQYLTVYWYGKQKQSCFLPNPLVVIYYLLFDLEHNCTMSRVLYYDTILSLLLVQGRPSMLLLLDTITPQTLSVPDSCTMVQRHCNLGASRIQSAAKHWDKSPRAHTSPSPLALLPLLQPREKESYGSHKKQIMHC